MGQDEMSLFRDGDEGNKESKDGNTKRHSIVKSAASMCHNVCICWVLHCSNIKPWTRKLVAPLHLSLPPIMHDILSHLSLMSIEGKKKSGETTIFTTAFYREI